MGACSALGITNQDALSEDLENDPFLNSALQRFTCELYYRFGSFLAPLRNPKDLRLPRNRRRKLIPREKINLLPQNDSYKNFFLRNYKL